MFESIKIIYIPITLAYFVESLKIYLFVLAQLVNLNSKVTKRRFEKLLNSKPKVDFNRYTHTLIFNKKATTKKSPFLKIIQTFRSFKLQVIGKTKWFVKYFHWSRSLVIASRGNNFVLRSNITFETFCIKCCCFWILPAFNMLQIKGA